MKMILNRLNGELVQLSSRLLSHPLARQLRQKYILLADKDKRLLQMLSLFLIIILLYSLVFSPAYTFFVSSNKNYEKQFEKSYVEPLKFITNAINWRIDDTYGTQATLMDFFS